MTGCSQTKKSECDRVVCGGGEFLMILDSSTAGGKLGSMVALPAHCVSISLEEYLQLEHRSLDKHEYWGGHIYAMAGGTPEHADISLNVSGELRAQLRGKPCAARGSDLRIHIEDLDVMTYPDVSVSCPPNQMSRRDQVSLADATVIVEVLSPSTASYDRGAKFEAYKLLPSLRHYVLVDQDVVHVELRTRASAGGEWSVSHFHTLEDVVQLDAINCELRLVDVYDRVFPP